MTNGNRAALVIILFAILAVPAPAPAQIADAVDPFYLNLLDGARSLYRDGSLAEAVEDLNIASFGFLDSPARLLECYVYLTLCHHELRNSDKVKFYVSEIKRLKLEEHMAASGLPEDLAKKYAEIALKTSRT